MHRALVEIGASLGATLVVVVGVLAAGNAVTPAHAPLPAHDLRQASCLEEPVLEIDGSGVTGRARLCILDEGVRPAADVEGLTPGTIYATWLAYFDRPQECRKPRCTLDNLQGDAAVGVAGRMDGVVANGIRKAQFHGDFRDLRLMSGSEVSVLVFERGPASMGDTRAHARQLLTLQLSGLDVPAAGPNVGGGRLVAQAVFTLRLRSTFDPD